MGVHKKIAQALAEASERIDFNPERRQRYRIPGTKTGVPGVTTILGQTVYKDLTWWSSGCAVDHIRTYLAEGVVRPWDDVLDEAYRAHDRVKREKGDIGSIAHDCIHAWAVGEQWTRYVPEDSESRNATRAAMRFLDDFVDEIFAAECTVVSPELTWAGTCDLVCVVDEKLTVVDWKSTKALYREHPLQVAAYAAGVDHALSVAGSNLRVEQTIVVHCSRDTGAYTHLVTEDWAADAAAFERCFLNYRQLQDVEKRIRAAVRPAKEKAA